MKDILITGGAGFIGSNFIFYLRDKYPNTRIICVDSLTYAGNLENLKKIPDSEVFKFYNVDIRNREKINDILSIEKPKIVVNFAAESHVDKSILNPGVFVETNVLGTSVLLDASMKHEVDRYHQISTDEVYGSLKLDAPEIRFTEDTALSPSSPYSSSKASADLLVSAYNHTYGLPTSITRCSNNYGPYQFPEKLIPLMITNSLNNHPLPLYGDGLNVRDWLYVEDHCSAIDCVITKGSDGCVYNVGGDNEQSNIEIVKIILSMMNKDESGITYVQDRKGHDRRYAVDASKLKKDLGWKPSIEFRDGIRQTVDWYISNWSWVEHILDNTYLKCRR